MISGGGMRPGDILTASNGKTIEVNNTDAEGRLTLADALVYASELKVDKVYSIHPLSSIILTSDSIHASATQDNIAVLISEHFGGPF
jgi:leucyl aminopeptidase